MLRQATKLVVVCYGGNRTLIQESIVTINMTVSQEELSLTHRRRMEQPLLFFMAAIFWHAAPIQ